MSSTNDLKDKLIDKIRETKNEYLLEEISHLFELQEPETKYHLNQDQKKAIEEGREQIKNDQFLTDDDANKDIDEWLNQ
jgi:hypothetical protein